MLYVHKDKIRHARKPLFQKLDVEFQIAMEKGEDLKPIAEKKQKLRDAPQNSKYTKSTIAYKEVD